MVEQWSELGLYESRELGAVRKRGEQEMQAERGVLERPAGVADASEAQALLCLVKGLRKA